MDVEITIAGSEDARGELESLRQWLNQDEDYRGLVDFAPAEIKPGELGALQEILLAAIAAGGLDALGRTIAVWLQTRQSTIAVKLRADGTIEEVSASGPIAKTVAENVFGDDPKRLGQGG
ncbi:hypothetical protein O1R50_05355 [Glycomyces luteolus]|uniref:Uncharacterized protein n=1 Tax=Glycomyces luteolus TaxID=2670330 RepID=A0A9X3SS67_9ACTN|nr:hypothetical protein [Glycomyces luteolus]MDA1359038.1 hypothetical protein [Glycomyces luteolus]